jgi:hypothetical protein
MGEGIYNGGVGTKAAARDEAARARWASGEGGGGQGGAKRGAGRGGLTKSANARRQLVSQRVVQCVANDRGGAGGRMPGLRRCEERGSAGFGWSAARPAGSVRSSWALRRSPRAQAPARL